MELNSRWRGFGHSDNVQMPASTHTPSPWTGSGPRVLVADDDSLMRWCVRETLSAGGCAVGEAASGREALQAFRDWTEPVDVVVLDYGLPDTWDLDLVSAIRRMFPDCRIILMTADPFPELTRRALALGVAAVLSKPFEMSQLAALVLGGSRVRARVAS
jgi:CheY-like chemotaxis protein